MRRSQIDTIIEQSQAIMTRHGQILPPYANWSPQQWHTKAAETRGMRARFLGWNVVEFVEGDFARSGVVVFTCLLYTSPSPRDGLLSRMPSSA